MRNIIQFVIPVAVIALIFWTCLEFLSRGNSVRVNGETPMSRRKVLWISAALAIVIPMPLFGLNDLVQYYPDFHFADIPLHRLLLTFCPFSIVMLGIGEPHGLGDIIAALSVALTFNVILYCTVGMLAWLAVNRNKAFWILVATFVLPVFLFPFVL